MSLEPDPDLANRLISDLRTVSEDSGVRHVVETRRWLHIAMILLRAALESGMAGNVRMRQALIDVWEFLPKTETVLPHPKYWPKPQPDFK